MPCLASTYPFPLLVRYIYLKGSKPLKSTPKYPQPHSQRQNTYTTGTLTQALTEMRCARGKSRAKATVKLFEFAHPKLTLRAGGTHATNHRLLMKLQS